MIPGNSFGGKPPFPIGMRFTLQKNPMYGPRLVGTICGSDLIINVFEPRHEKTSFLRMQKQRRRSASW